MTQGLVSPAVSYPSSPRRPFPPLAKNISCLSFSQRVSLEAQQGL